MDRSKGHVCATFLCDVHILQHAHRHTHTHSRKHINTQKHKHKRTHTSQDNLERVKFTTWRGLYSWSGQSRRPLSRGGGNKKNVKTLTKLYGTSHTISDSLKFSRQTHVIEIIHPEYEFCQHTDAQDASMHSPRITCINASTN
jgi:hypothetical protein